MTNNTPSGTKKHYESTKSESPDGQNVFHSSSSSSSYIRMVELYTELFYAIISTLSLCFLLICYPYILLHFLLVLY